jgi:hydrogenase maturation protease
MDIRVIGLGNAFMSDDGFGPYVIRVLDAFYEFPLDVRLVDGGRPGVDLTPVLLDAKAAIVVDTVKAAGAPGDIRVYDRADILRSAPPARISPHDAGLKAALLTGAAAGTGPSSLKLYGVIPEWVATGVHLSRNVRSAVAPVIGLVITRLERLGVHARLRPGGRRPDVWWDAGEVFPAPMGSIAGGDCRGTGRDA